MNFKNRLMSRTEPVTFSQFETGLIRMYLLSYMEKEVHPTMSDKLIRRFTGLYLRVTRQMKASHADFSFNLADCAFIANLNHRYWEQNRTDLLTANGKGRDQILHAISRISQITTNAFVDLCPDVPLGIQFWKEYVINFV